MTAATIDERAPEFDEEPVEDADDEGGQRRRGAGWAGWAISFCFHTLLIALMASIYFLVTVPEVDVPPVRVATIEPPPKKEEKPKEERTLQTEIQLEVEAESDHPNPISQLDLPVEISEREEESDSPVAKGREEAVADAETGGSGAFMAIGAGGGSAGMFGARSGGGKKRAVGRFGGSKGSESAVDASLRWFKKHQSPNGMWDFAAYPANCTEDPKCEPGVNSWADRTATVGITGYAVLCFLGAGYDHQTPNKYKQTVKKGLDYLLSIQKPDGVLGTSNYENAVATMALAEAYAMTGDPALKAPAQHATDSILARQNRDLANAGAKDAGYGNGFGWDYFGPTARNDSSVTGWNVMALKSCLAAQLSIGTGMEGAKVWLEQTWKATNPEWAKLDPYTGQSRFPYTIDSVTRAIQIAAAPAPGARALDSWDLTCVGAVCAVFLGHHAGDTMLETFANDIMDHEFPKAYPCNTYKLYYNTLSMFQIGGERWKKWNATARDLLVQSQRKGNGCFDGSWDFNEKQFPGAIVGRTLSTAYCCLSLEVYYRYAQVAAKK
ncbi:MAG: terpene cyclase/mutase family protein [Planctomycetes bacterium]|nr:terpene cyclase/mutase family protein [Planctomycetota bacterium]